jgi:hypothetical protein
MPILLSIVRHLLTLAAGSLLTIGISEDDAAGLVKAAEPVVAGAILYGGAQVWSVVEKKKRR